MSTVFLQPLCQILPRQTATVAKVCAEGKKALRLAEMGFVSGAFVRLVRRAPYGGGVEVELLDCRVCLRRADAEQILVLGFGQT